VLHRTLLCLLLLHFVGCASVKTVDRAQLDYLKTHSHEPKVSTWYYMGSKDGFHYFHHIDLPGDSTYRISETELRWPGSFPLTRDEKKWKLLDSGPLQSISGGNGNP